MPAVTTPTTGMTGTGSGNQGPLSALGAGGGQQTFVLQCLQMVTDGCGGAQTHGCADFPDRGGITVLLDELVYIFHDAFCLIAGSWHGHPSVSFGVFIIAHMNEKEKVFSKKYSQKPPPSQLYW